MWDAIFQSSPAGESSDKPTIPPPHNPDVSRPENTVSAGSGSGFLAFLDGAEMYGAPLLEEVRLTPNIQEAVLQEKCGCGSHMVVKGATAFCAAPLCHGVDTRPATITRRMGQTFEGAAW